MSRAVPVIALAALAAAAALSSARPADACACGIAIEASVHEEAALVIERPGSEEIVLSLGLESEGDERAAVVLPVPGEPTVTAVREGDPLAYLQAATRPEPAVGSAAGGGDDTAAAPPVDVIGRETVGGYDVARLGAGDAAALERWLADNGYALPDGAEPILADYVERDWRFVAIRLAPESTGRLKPLAVSFPVDEYVYPMKLEQLATEPLDLTLFTLADGPRRVAGLNPVWVGTVDELSPPPPAEMAALFSEGEYVTRLEASDADPAYFTEDLLIDATDEELEQTSGAPVLVTAEESGVSSAGVIALICAGLAFAIGLGLITRPRRD